MKKLEQCLTVLHAMGVDNYIECCTLKGDSEEMAGFEAVARDILEGEIAFGSGASMEEAMDGLHKVLAVLVARMQNAVEGYNK